MDFEWLSSLSLYTRISIWFTVVPVLFCIPVLFKMQQARLMFLLLLTGLFTELSTQKAGVGSSYSYVVFLTYSIIECVVFTSVSLFGENSVRPKSLLISLVGSVGLVALCLVIFRASEWAIAIFNMVYQIVIAAFCGRNLLRKVETTPEPSSDATFWLHFGIFFYCFTTFFLMGIIGVSAKYKLWDPYHNTINIVTYIVYACAFRIAMKDLRSRMTT